MDTLDLIKGTTAESLEAVRADFDDLPRGHFRAAQAKGMTRIIDATADERSAEAKSRAKNRRPARAPRVSVVEVHEDGHNGDRCDNPRCCPQDGPRDARTPAQVTYMENLISWITEKDADLGRQAREYTDGMTKRGRWEAGRDTNVSRWINNLKAKNAELNAAARLVQRTAPAAVKSNWTDIPNGYYALVEDAEADVIKFYRIKHAQNGWVYVDAMASDKRHPIRNAVTKQRVLKAIREMGWEASRGLYGNKIGRCGRCHLTLTNADSRAKGIGPDCEGRM